MTVASASNLPVKAITSADANAARHGAYYNGFFFPPTSTFKAYSRPVYSNNGRTIKRRNPVISIEFDLFPQDYVDSGTWGPNESRVLTNIQNALEQPAKIFCIAEGGVGNYCVNATKSTDRGVFPSVFTDFDDEDTGRMIYAKDLEGGPKPKLTVYDPFPGGEGTNKVHVVWEVELAINTCGFWAPSTTDSDGWEVASGTVLDTVAEVSYSVEDGLSVRTIHLEVEILNLYEDTTSRGLEKSLDYYAILYANAIKVPKAHKRSIDRNLGADGKTFRLTIVDRQIDAYSPFPIGLRDISLVLTYSTAQTPNAQQNSWDVSVDYSATVYPGVPKAYALEPFLRYIAFQRVREQSVLKPGGFMGARVPMNPDQANQNMNPMREGIQYLTAFQLGPTDLYRHTLRIRLEYVSLFSIAKIFVASGVLDPLILSSWEQWGASAAPMHEADGVLGIRQTRTHTDLANLCGGQVSAYDHSFSPKAVAQLLGQISSICPPPDKSWMDFKNRFEFSGQENVVSLQKAVALPPPQDNLAGNGNFDRLQQNRQLPGQGQQQGQQGNNNQIRELLLQPTFQVGAQGDYYVRMIGYAYRIGYTILIPKLLAYQGANCVVHRVYKQIMQPYAQTAGGCVQYVAEWDVVYRLDRMPNGNPAQTLFAAPIPTLPSTLGV